VTLSVHVPDSQHDQWLYTEFQHYVSPSYIADDCRPVASPMLVSNDNVPQETNTHCEGTHSTFGDRAFAAAGPGLWNSLPSHLKEADLSYNEFRWLLKTFLFG